MDTSPLRVDAPAAEPGGAVSWLQSFHQGEREVLEACYREHFDTVARAVGGVLAAEGVRA